MKLENCGPKVLNVQLFFFVVALAFTLGLSAQTYFVNGLITALSNPVENAEVTFIDSEDTTKQYSALTDSLGAYQLDVLTSIAVQNNQIISFELAQNYPNPFSSSTAISYKLHSPSEVEVTIYDVLGREIKKYNVGVQLPGVHGVVWDGKNNLGERVAMGIYFYRIQAGGETQVKKMIFGTGIENFTVRLPKSISPQTSEMNEGMKEFRLAGNFTVRIENTDSIFPAITPRQIENVEIQSDTTLDFAVAKAAIVYLDSTQQVISGFGAANIVGWRPDMTTDEINTAFGTGDEQIGFTILRFRVPWNQNDFNINVPSAQAAHAMGVKIIASPWTPPPGLKTNNNIVGGRLREDSYAAYAAHLKSFADYMSNNGVPIYAISVQNEPDVQVTYESCDWNAAEMLRFMKENAPDVGTGVFAAESFNFNHTMTDPILNDSIAASHTAFIGGHIYGGGLIRYPLAEAKGKEVWMTEHLELSDDWDGALATGKEINDCMKANMSAYIWWYIVRFYGPILEDGTVSKRGYVMSQFSRFIRPGFFRVTADDNPQPNLYLTVYRDGAKVVIVAINYNYQSIDQAFKIENSTVANFIPYVTSESKNATQEDDIAMLHGFLTVALEPRSVTTFVSE